MLLMFGAFVRAFAYVLYAANTFIRHDYGESSVICKASGWMVSWGVESNGKYYDCSSREVCMLIESRLCCPLHGNSLRPADFSTPELSFGFGRPVQLPSQCLLHNPRLALSSCVSCVCQAGDGIYSSRSFLYLTN